MADKRWNIKGSDDSVHSRFKDVTADYNRQFDEHITEERALELLMDGVPIEGKVDTDAILEKLDGLDESVADSVEQRMRG